MSDKKPKQKVVTVGEIDFTLQHPGVRKALQIQDTARGPHGMLGEPLYSELMEHVIVNPKTKWEYWDEHDDIMDEVMKEAFRFLITPGKTA